MEEQKELTDGDLKAMAFLERINELENRNADLRVTITRQQALIQELSEQLKKDENSELDSNGE